MKKILLGTILTSFCWMGMTSAQAAFIGWGTGTIGDPKAHLAVNPACATLINIPATIWVDPGMVAATGIDYLATKKHNKKTIDAKDALKKLEDALSGGCSGGSGANDETTLDAASAAAYCSDTVLSALDETKIELSQTSDSDYFNEVRGAVQNYVFESDATDLLADCSYSGTDRAKNCAVERQDSWLLTSITLASATADKVLANSVKSGVTETGSKGGDSPLTAHFETLASNFNAQTSPKAMYGKMADIVLDTHTQMNESNALLARDLEAQSLRSIRDAGPVFNTTTE